MRSGAGAEHDNAWLCCRPSRRAAARRAVPRRAVPRKHVERADLELLVLVVDDGIEHAIADGLGADELDVLRVVQLELRAQGKGTDKRSPTATAEGGNARRSDGTHQAATLSAMSAKEMRE